MKLELEYIIIFAIMVIFISSIFKIIYNKCTKCTSVKPNTKIRMFPETKKNKKESKGEAICRRTMENQYGKKFINVRPDWLVNPVTGRKLELDVYNDELKIAIEYNGQQHAKFVKKFHLTEDKFKQQQYRDLIKQDLCQKNNVLLITVPHTVSFKNIPTYIKNQLIINGRL